MGDINNKKLASISLLTLPSFPDTLLELIDACRQAFPDSEALEAIVSKDIVLCTRLLDLAAAHTPSGRRVTRLADLIDEVGVDALRTLAMSAAVNLVFAEDAALPGGASRKLDAGLSVADKLSLRRKCVEQAQLARQIALRLSYPAPDEAYLAGLLQGLGELALATQLPEYRALSRAQEQSPRAANEPAVSDELARTDEFGAAGAALGHWIVRNMQLDSLLADALLYCSEPIERLRGVHPLLKIARVANTLSQGDRAASERQAAAELLGLREQELQRITDAAREALERSIGASGAVQPPAPALRVVDTNAPAPQQNEDEIQRYQELRARLVEQVRSQGLLSGTRPKFSNGGGLHGVLRAVRKSLHILFGHRRCFFFMHDSGRNSLQGTPLDNDLVTLGEFVLPCSPGVSMLSEAFLRAQPVASPTQREMQYVVDQMLARLTHSDALLCVPLAARERKLGVILIGADELSAAALQAHAPLLQTFAQQAAAAVARQLQPKLEQPEDAVALEAAQVLQRIAQDVSNPLAIMKNYVKILRMKLAQEDAAQPSLTVIDEEIDRVTDIIRTADKPLSLMIGEAPVSDVNEAVFEIVKAEGPAWAKRGVGVRTDLHHSIPPLGFERASLKQVLLNLLRNAAEAMSGGGEVVVATRRDYVSDDGKLCVEIIVKDNGPGIARRVLDKLFQPVRSTKGDAHAGLGLHIVRNLVMQMGGVIQCHSTPKRGTLFQILLPQTESQAQSSA